MKTLKYFLPIIFLVTLTQASCSNDDDDVTTTTPVVATLTEAEKEGLIQMREEEKLARDVYLYSFDLYGTQIFSNISNAEQTHMDGILDLLKTYNLTDPASTERGVFNDPGLQTLYNDLTALSEKSLLDAFLVGATIEDLDIYDLEELMKTTNKSDILLVYDNLNCGSRNHMRAYTSQIVGEGSTYTVQFITAQRYQEILAGDHEKCGGN